MEKMKYSWTDTVYKAFSKTFPHDYEDDALCFLHKCIKDEFYQAVKSKEENRLEKLYICLGDFYKHFCWKINWKKDSLCSMKKSCLVILSYLIQTGVILSKGKLSLKWINNILAAMQVFPGSLELLHYSLILIHNVKKKFEPTFSVVLKHFLFTNKVNASKAIDYFKIMLLLRRLKSMSESKLERAKVVTFALKFKAPSDAQSWLLSHGIENLTDVNSRLFTKVFLSNKKLPPDFFIKLWNVLEREVQFKEDFYLPSALKDSFVIDAGIVNQCESAIKKVPEALSIKDDTKMFVDPLLPDVSFVSKKIKLSNSSTVDVVDSNALVEPSYPSVSFVNKMRKTVRLTSSSAEDNISSNVVCTTKHFLDTKAKETTGDMFSNGELKVDSCLSNDVKDLFYIDTEIVNQYKSAIDVADAALFKDGSELIVDSSFDSYTSTQYVSKKRKKIKLPKTSDTGNCGESSLVNEHLPEFDNEVVENDEHKKAQRLKKVSILQPLTPESKRDEKKVKSISESERKDDQVKSISLPVGPETIIKHNQVSFEPCAKANETMLSTCPNSESITFSEEKLTDFCEMQHNKHTLTNSTGHIPNCMCGDEKEESASDSKNIFLKQIELHPSSIKPEDPVKLQLTVGENNDKSLSNVEIVPDKEDSFKNKDFSSECTLMNFTEEERSKISEINCLSNNSSINLERKSIEYSTIHLPVSEIRSEAFHNKSPEQFLPSPKKSPEGKQSQNNKVPKENKGACPTEIGSYIEGVLYTLVDEVVNRINNKAESSWETPKEKSVQLDLTVSEPSTNTNINKYKTFSDISKQTTVDCKECNSLSEVGTKSYLLDYRDDCSELEVNLNVSTTEFPESDCGNEDLEEDISDYEFHSDSAEHSFDEDTQSHDLEIENKNSSQSEVIDCKQSKSDLTFTLEEAANFVAKLPCLSVELGKRCYGKNTSKELTQESEVGNLLPKIVENKDHSFSETSHETLLNDPNGNDFLTNKAGGNNIICDADDHEIVVNESDKLLGIEVKGTEISANRTFIEVLQSVVSIKKLENNCDIYDELKGIENKENVSSVECSIQMAKNAYGIAKENKLELYELSNPPIANDESSLQIHSQDSLKFSNNNTEKDSLFPESSIPGKDLSVLTEHLEHPSTVLISPVKQLRVLRQRKAVVSNQNDPLASLKKKKKIKIDCSDPVLTSNLSQLTLNSPSRTKPDQISTKKSNQQCAKLLGKKKVIIQISDTQPESKKCYNLRSRKPLIQPGKLKYPK